MWVIRSQRSTTKIKSGNDVAEGGAMAENRQRFLKNKMRGGGIAKENAIPYTF